VKTDALKSNGTKNGGGFGLASDKLKEEYSYKPNKKRELPVLPKEQ
jgi:hypothetical protein